MRLVGVFAFFVAILAPASVRGGPIVIGTADPGTGNCFPLGCGPASGAGTIFQQVYAASDFAAPIDITTISFFRTQLGNPTDRITDATYTIQLSYSANPVNGLDTTTFSNNVGAGQVTFGTYVFSGVQIGAGVTFIDNNSDFVYNPLNGPLLVQISLSGVGRPGNSFFDYMIGDSGGLFSRADNFGSGFANYGLVTGFDSGPLISGVPEPATLALCGGGLAALAFLRLRRKRPD